MIYIFIFNIVLLFDCQDYILFIIIENEFYLVFFVFCCIELMVELDGFGKFIGMVIFDLGFQKKQKGI